MFDHEIAQQLILGLFEARNARNKLGIEKNGALACHRMHPHDWMLGDDWVLAYKPTVLPRKGNHLVRAVHGCQAIEEGLDGL